MSQGRRSKALVLGAFFLTVAGVPVFELCGGSFPGAGVPSSWGVEEILAGKLRPVVERDLENNSRSAALVRPLYNEAMLGLLREATASVVLCPDDWMFLASTVRGYPPPNYRATIDDTLVLIQGLAEWFEAQGCTLFVCVVPNKATLYPHHLDHVRPRLRTTYDEIWSALEGSPLWCVDLRDALNPDDLKSYLSFDTHWTPEGAVAGARAVVDELRRRWDGELPGVPVSGELFRGERGPHPGALYELLDLRAGSPLAARYSEETGALYGVEAGTGEPLGVATEEDWVLVGTSFSNQFRFASLLSLQAGRRVQDRSIFGQGPTRAVLEVADAVRQGERAAPHVVVWEFPERYFFESPALMQEPLGSFLRSLEFEQASTPLAYTHREAVNLDLVELEDGWIQGEPRPLDASLVYDLAQPLPGDGSVAVVYTIVADRVTLTEVHFDLGQGFEELLMVHTLVGKKHVPQLVVVPVRTPDGAPVRRLRIDPVRGKMAFRMSPVEVRERRTP